MLAVVLGIQAVSDTISTEKIHGKRLKHEFDSDLAKGYYNYISHRNMYTTSIILVGTMPWVQIYKYQARK